MQNLKGIKLQNLQNHWKTGNYIIDAPGGQNLHDVQLLIIASIVHESH